MMESTEEKTFTAAVGFGTCSGRHEVGVDPATLASPSYEGPNTGFAMGPVQNVTTVAVYEEKVREREKDREHQLSQVPVVNMECTPDIVYTEDDDDRLSTISSRAPSRKRGHREEEDSGSEIGMEVQNLEVTEREIKIKRRKDKEKDKDKELQKEKRVPRIRSQEYDTDATDFSDVIEIEQDNIKEEFKEPVDSRQEPKRQMISKVAKLLAVYEKMSTATLKKTAVELLNDIEYVRTKSQRIQGKYNGVIKDRIVGLKDIISCLVDKAEFIGDPSFYKMESISMKGELKCIREEKEKLEREQKRKDKEIQLLTEKNENLEATIWKLSRGIPINEKEDVLPETKETIIQKKIDREKEELNRNFPVLRPSIRGVRKQLLTATTTMMASSSEPLPGTSKKEKKNVNTNKKEELTNIHKEMKLLQERRRELIQENLDRESEGEEQRKDRGKPRIKDNIQIAPPTSKTYDEGRESVREKKTDEGWDTVRKKQRRKKDGNSTRPPDRKTEKSVVRKLPRTAVVALRVEKNDLTYAQILRTARENISLTEIGIESSKIRKGINGGLLIEVAGPEGNEKANKLAVKLKDILKENVAVTRPIIRAELRISGFDDSITSEEIRYIISQKGDCNIDDVKVGSIKWMANGLGTIWAKCPLMSANKLVANNKIKMGWTIAKIEMLKTRPLQCYRCWEYGHVKFSCTSEIDRTQNCYNCGIEGHRAKDCSQKIPTCVICAEKKLPSEHRLGANVCSLDKYKSRGKILPRNNPIKEGRVQQFMDELDRNQARMDTDYEL